MRIHHSYELPGTVPALLQALGTPELHERRAARLGARAEQPAISADDSGLTVHNRWYLPSTRLPNAARMLVGPELVLVEDQEWQVSGGGAEGRLRQRTERVDAGVDARCTVEPAASGCLLTVEGEVTARVPLVGSRIEQAMAPMVRSAIDRTAEVLRDWLAERG